jgi:hypothetical protein
MSWICEVDAGLAIDIVLIAVVFQIIAMISVDPFIECAEVPSETLRAVFS